MPDPTEPNGPNGPNEQTGPNGPNKPDKPAEPTPPTPTPPRPREPADDDTAFVGRVPPPRQPGDTDELADLHGLGDLGDFDDLGDLDDLEGFGDVADLPQIDADELAGLEPVSAPTSGVRRVQPLSDEPSNLVARYLFPTERYRGEWRRHLIHLATPLTVGVGGTVVLGLGAGVAQAYLGVPWLAPIAVLAWLVVMVWVMWQIAHWHFDRFILTNKRVMKVSGIVSRDVAMMPLLRVTDMKYEQTPLGRMLNYGTFVIESAGQDQALREIEHLPNPNELYLRVVEEMYDPGAVEARVDQEGGEDERHPSGDA